ncbi:hypothetical protein [Acidovorax sp.]|uniref:hypothetical protein n=1 Tax=Acidovorax sp. TaxID=1872122 RepID=UPI0026182722|nr:hypothetical protein [Acidovorax sp.]
MIITAATPQELVNWFHTRQEEQRVLCVMLAPAQDDQRKVSQLIAELFEADAALGEEVAFLLIHPTANTPLGLDKGYGSFATLRGSAFPSHTGRRGLAYSLRDAEVFRDMSNEGAPYRQEVADKSARAMALFVPEFMKLFGVSQRDLPAMCVLVKGLDESIILPLGKEWTRESLLELLGRIRDVGDALPNFLNEYQSLADAVPAKLLSASEAKREIDAKISHIVEILERLARRHRGTEGDRTLIADFVARGCPSAKQLQDVLGRLSFCSTDRYLKDGQVGKALALMSKVDAVRDGLSQDLQARRYVLSIADRARQLVERREQLFFAINDLRNARIATTSAAGSGSLGRVRSTLEGVNLTGDLGEKLFAAIDWVRKLVGA